MKVIILCSTAGSVFKRCFNEGLLAEYDLTVISDRECGAIEFAKSRGIANFVLESINGKEFSDKLNEMYPQNLGELFISFYTKLLKGLFLDKHKGRLINFHPSILPACPGRDGFGDSIKSGALFLGSTVHWIDEGMDTGKPILQTAFPNDEKVALEIRRHRVYLQQVISMAQVLYWFRAKKIGAVGVENGEFKFDEFSPNLDPVFKEIYKRLE